MFFRKYGPITIALVGMECLTLVSGLELTLQRCVGHAVALYIGMKVWDLIHK